MSRSRIIGDSLPPATVRVRVVGGAVYLCPAWWWPEVKKHTDQDRAVGYSLVCHPSTVAEASRDAALWLQAIGAVVPR